MIAKLGLILLVLLFGGLMFVGGAIAPDAWRRPLTDMAAKIAPSSAAPTPKSEKPEPPAATKEPASDNKKTAIPYEVLLLPTPLPPQGTYALQLGPYTDAASADLRVKSAAAAGYPAQAIAVEDKNGAAWIVVAVGKYASPDDARSAQGQALQRLKLERLPTVILAPAAANGTAP